VCTILHRQLAQFWHKTSSCSAHHTCSPEHQQHRQLAQHQSCKCGRSGQHSLQCTQCAQNAHQGQAAPCLSGTQIHPPHTVGHSSLLEQSQDANCVRRPRGRAAQAAKGTSSLAVTAQLHADLEQVAPPRLSRKPTHPGHRAVTWVELTDAKTNCVVV
jgi:hypothetical protein